MFNAPEVITKIPDIAKIYEINNGQITELDADVDQLDGDIFVDTMSDATLKQWEKIYDIKAFDDESLDDRRTKVKGKMLEKLPYSYRVIVRNLDALLPNGYDLIIDEDLLSVTVRVNLTDRYLITNVQKLLEDVVPLNMELEVILKYNSYNVLAMHTHGELEAYTYQGLREESLV